MNLEKTYPEIVDSFGGRISIQLYDADLAILDVVNDLSFRTRDADYFCLAVDMPRLISGVGVLKKKSFDNDVLQLALRYGLIHANNK